MKSDSFFWLGVADSSPFY